VRGQSTADSLFARAGDVVPAGMKLGGAAAVMAVVAFLMAWQPFLASGVVFGTLLIWITVTWPMAVVGVMLALGPVDVSFLTGGFKGLFPGLGGLDMNGIRLLGITAGFTAVIVTDRQILRSLTSPPVLYYLLFMGWCVASLAWSADPIEGARLLFKLAYPALTFLVVAAPGRTEGEVDRLATWALVGATVLLLLNPVYVVANGFERDIEGHLRLQGPGSHQNPFSFYLLAIVLLCAARFTVRGQRRYLFLALLAAGWMALTLTRITLLAALVGLTGMGLYGALVNRNYRAAAVAVGLAALIGVALSPIVLVRTFGHLPSLPELVSLLRDPLFLFNAVNWQGREIFWAILAQAWSTSPWIGLGMGASTVALQVIPSDLPMVAHNEYLRLGVDTGWVGVGLFFLAMVAWLKAVLRAGRTGGPSVREYALPGLAGILAWAIIAATDNAFDYYGAFTQFIALFVAGAVVTARQRGGGAVATPALRAAAEPLDPLRDRR